jgi:hypothetical protein
MANFLKANGQMERKMGLECGEALKVILIKDNGLKIGNKAKEFLYILRVPMKDNFLIFISMDMANKYLKMAINILGNIKMGNPKVKADMSGAME